MSKPVDFMIHIHLDDEDKCDGCQALQDCSCEEGMPPFHCQAGFGYPKAQGGKAKWELFALRPVSCVAMSDKQEQCKISGK